MNCDEAKNHLYDYILDELDPAIEIQVNDHIAMCEDCRKELEQNELLISFFKDSRKFKPDRTVYQKILNAKALAIMPEGHSTQKIPAGLISAVVSFFLGIVIMYGVDMLFLNKKIERKGTEVRSEPAHKVPFSDTVKFYYAPSKNLAQI